MASTKSTDNAIKCGNLIINNSICNLVAVNGSLKIYSNKLIEEGVYPLSAIVQTNHDKDGNPYQVIVLH